MSQVGMPPVAAVLPDGRRHFQHGPIDLILEAFGEQVETEAAYGQAWRLFRTLLEDLVAELPDLRRPVDEAPPRVLGSVARRMVRACAPHRDVFITPMAAVAGAVADAVLTAMTADRRLTKAYVNNGGDIALFLTPGQALTTGVVTLGERPCLDAYSRIDAASAVRGIATSGWRGRSLSLGIADSVTVLARSAAEADATATLIANAVDFDDPVVRREPASALDPDSDLGARLVTVEVGPLSPEKIEVAVGRGVSAARDMIRRGVIIDAVIVLQNRLCVAGETHSSAA